MANISGSYDTNAEPSADFSPLPAAEYRAKIIGSDVEPISKKDNKGRCLKLTWQVETGPYDNRLFWQRLNMWPENMDNMDKVVTIANSQFASIRQATGKLAPQDSSELHHIPCAVYVGLSKPQPGFNQQNEVKSVKAIAAAPGGPSPAAPAQRQAPAPNAQQNRAPASNTGGSAPWRKSA